MTDEQDVIGELQYLYGCEAGAYAFWEDLKKYQPYLYKQLLYAAQDETAKELDAIKHFGDGKCIL